MSIEPSHTLDLNLSAASRVARLREILIRNVRTQFSDYLRVFAGTGMRLGLQAVYFFVLANTLSLHDMGIFASTSSTGIMIGSFAGFGFSSFAFRAAAHKRRALGGHLAVFYIAWLISLPLCLAASLPVFYFLFTTSLTLTAFLSIIVVETATWRIVEMIHQVNNGLGRFGSASMVISLGTALRAAGAVVFVLSGRHDVETWSHIYLLFNLAAMLLAIVFYQPRIKLRWRASMFFGRFHEAFMYAIAYSAFTSQSEIDKVVMLSLADQRTVGIYAIASRLIDFTSVPIRTFYVLYSRKLILEGRAGNKIARSLSVEVMIATISTVAFAGLLAVLWMWPGLLGHNVATAIPLLMVALAVPAFKNMLEYHSELFFVYERMTIRAVLATSQVAIKAGALAMLLIYFTGIGQWGVWLNAIYIGLYVLSAAIVYRFIFGNEKQ